MDHRRGPPPSSSSLRPAGRRKWHHLIHQGYSESLANGISMVIKYDREIGSLI